jgi:hypothetical protein
LDDTRKIEKVEYLSSIGTEISYIILEKDDFIVSRIRNLKIHNNYIYINDELSSKIAIYSSKGKFLNVINSKGHGPNEYVQITDWDINPENMSIYIYDTGNQKFLAFDTTGQCIKEKNNERKGLKLTFFKHQLFLYHPRPSNHLFGNDYSFSVFDLDFSLIGQQHYSPYKYDVSDMITWNSINLVSNELHFWEASVDTVYGIDGNIIKPMFAFNFGKESMPLDIRKNSAKWNANFRNYFIISRILESKDYIFLTGALKGYVKNLVYLKNKSEIFSLKEQKGFDEYSNGFYDNIDGFIPFWPQYVTPDGRYAVDWIEPNVFLEFIAKKQLWFYKVKNSSDLIWKSINEKITLEDNPIVRIVKLKN